MFGCPGAFFEGEGGNIFWMPRVVFWTGANVFGCPGSFFAQRKYFVAAQGRFFGQRKYFVAAQHRFGSLSIHVL